MIKNTKTELGKMLAYLRIENSESVKTQAQRLGFDKSLISLVCYGKRGFTVNLYLSVLENYGINKDSDFARKMRQAMCKNEIVNRLLEVTKNSLSDDDIFYILYGEKV